MKNVSDEPKMVIVPWSSKNILISRVIGAAKFAKVIFPLTNRFQETDVVHEFYLKSTYLWPIFLFYRNQSFDLLCMSIVYISFYMTDLLT